VHNHVCLSLDQGLGVCIINKYVSTKEKSKQLCIIYPLSVITGLISAFFGLDNRQCECLEYLSLFI
jgi:hypothetical protein